MGGKLQICLHCWVMYGTRNKTYRKLLNLCRLFRSTSNKQISEIPVKEANNKKCINSKHSEVQMLVIYLHI